MTRSGPVTKDTSSVMIGLMQIRIGASSTNIAKIHPQFSASDSLGALANTKYVGEVDWARLMSGFPEIEDYSVPIRQKAHLECAFKEVTPKTLAISNGIAYAGFTLAHSGEIPIGNLTAPQYVRMEGVSTYPDGVHYLTIIFPRAQITGNVELDFATEEFSASPMVVEAKNASSDVSGGHACWDNKPLGRIVFT